MKQGIRQAVPITCMDVDLTTVSDLKVYVRQERLKFIYTPVVTSPHEMYILVPKADALRLHDSLLRLQFAFIDAKGEPDYSNIVTCEVDEFLEEDGYGPD